MDIIYIAPYISPAGKMILGSLAGSLCLCDWDIAERRKAIDRRICLSLNAHYEAATTDVISYAIGQLDQYFAGKRRDFTIPIRFSGTGFQCRVWSELMRIPYGETISYAGFARRVGNPKAVRAVATAIAANPISIFVPCHRVIGSDSRLTGYAGGLDAKSYLLTLEAGIKVYRENNLFSSPDSV